MSRFSTKAIVKGALFLAFLVGVWFAIRNPAVQSFVSKESIEAFVEGFGIFGPIVYILVYAVGVSVLLPGTPLTAVGAILFGTVWGTIYTIIGATIGATSAFWIARTLGHDFAQSLFGEKIKKYDEKMATHGFATIFYLRLVFFPFNVLNFGAGLTKVRFKDYLLGTFLGIIPGTFIITFFVDAVADAFFAHGLFSTEFLLSLLTARVLTAIVLFALSFFIPSLVKKIAEKFGRKDLVNV